MARWLLYACLLWSHSSVTVSQSLGEGGAENYQGLRSYKYVTPGTQNVNCNTQIKSVDAPQEGTIIFGGFTSEALNKDECSDAIQVPFIQAMQDTGETVWGPVFFNQKVGKNNAYMSIDAIMLDQGVASTANGFSEKASQFVWAVLDSNDKNLAFDRLLKMSAQDGTIIDHWALPQGFYNRREAIVDSGTFYGLITPKSFNVQKVLPDGSMKTVKPDLTVYEFRQRAVALTRANGHLVIGGASGWDLSQSSMLVIVKESDFSTVYWKLPRPGSDTIIVSLTRSWKVDQENVVYALSVPTSGFNSDIANEDYHMIRVYLDTSQMPECETQTKVYSFAQYNSVTYALPNKIFVTHDEQGNDYLQYFFVSQTRYGSLLERNKNNGKYIRMEVKLTPQKEICTLKNDFVDEPISYFEVGDSESVYKFENEAQQSQYDLKQLGIGNDNWMQAERRIYSTLQDTLDPNGKVVGAVPILYFWQKSTSAFQQSVKLLPHLQMTKETKYLDAKEEITTNIESNPVKPQTHYYSDFQTVFEVDLSQITIDATKNVQGHSLKQTGVQLMVGPRETVPQNAVTLVEQGLRIDPTQMNKTAIYCWRIDGVINDESNQLQWSQQGIAYVVLGDLDTFATTHLVKTAAVNTISPTEVWFTSSEIAELFQIAELQDNEKVEKRFFDNTQKAQIGAQWTLVSTNLWVSKSSVDNSLVIDKSKITGETVDIQLTVSTLSLIVPLRLSITQRIFDDQVCTETLLNQNLHIYQSVQGSTKDAFKHELLDFENKVFVYWKDEKCFDKYSVKVISIVDADQKQWISYDGQTNQVTIDTKKVYDAGLTGSYQSVYFMVKILYKDDGSDTGLILSSNPFLKVYICPVPPEGAGMELSSAKPWGYKKLAFRHDKSGSLFGPSYYIKFTNWQDKLIENIHQPSSFSCYEITTDPQMEGIFRSNDYLYMSSYSFKPGQTLKFNTILNWQGNVMTPVSIPTTLTITNCDALQNIKFGIYKEVDGAREWLSSPYSHEIQQGESNLDMSEYMVGAIEPADESCLPNWLYKYVDDVYQETLQMNSNDFRLHNLQIGLQQGESLREYDIQLKNDESGDDSKYTTSVVIKLYTCNGIKVNADSTTSKIVSFDYKKDGIGQIILSDLFEIIYQNPEVQETTCMQKIVVTSMKVEGGQRVKSSTINVDMTSGFLTVDLSVPMDQTIFEVTVTTAEGASAMKTIQLTICGAYKTMVDPLKKKLTIAVTSKDKPVIIEGSTLTTRFYTNVTCGINHMLSISNSQMYDSLPSSLADGGKMVKYNKTTYDIVLDGQWVSVGHPDNFTVYFWGRQNSELMSEGDYVEIFVDVSELTKGLPSLTSFVKNFPPAFELTPEDPLEYVIKEGDTSSVVKWTSPRVEDVEGDPYELSMDTGTADYEKFSKFATYSMNPGENGPASFSISMDTELFKPEMAGEYEVKVAIMHDEDQLVKQGFKFQLTYEFLNGTKVKDFEKGDIEHPEQKKQEKEKDDVSKPNKGGNASGFRGVIMDDEKVVQNKEPVKEKPFTISVSNVGRDGTVDIEFSQEIIEPEWLKNKRLLQENKTTVKDIFAIAFKSTIADLKGEKVKYDLQVKKWQPPHLTLAMNLDDPSSMSRNQPDTMTIELLKPDYFRSKTGNKTLDMQVAKIVTQIPKQLPPGVTEAEIVETAQKQVNNVQYMMIVQLVVQPILKSGLESLWSIFFLMQLANVLPLYYIYIPAETDIYLQEVRALVDFDKLTPDFLLGLIEPGLSLKTLFGGKNETSDVPLNMQATGIKSANPLENLQLYIFVLVLFTCLMALLHALSKVKRVKKMVNEVKDSLIAATFYNGIIRSISISYLKQCLSAYANSTSEIASEAYQGWATYGVVVGYAIYLTVFITIKKPQLRMRDSLKKFGVLFNQLSIYRDKFAKYFHVLFLMRRLWLVSLVAFLPKNSSIHIIFLIMQELFYVIIYAQVMNMPHETKRGRWTELFNESIMMIILYHVIFLTDLSWNAMGQNAKLVNEFQLRTGNQMVLFLAGCFLVNISVHIYVVTSEICHKCQLKWRRRVVTEARRERLNINNDQSALLTLQNLLQKKDEKDNKTVKGLVSNAQILRNLNQRHEQYKKQLHQDALKNKTAQRGMSGEEFGFELEEFKTLDQIPEENEEVKLDPNSSKRVEAVTRKIFGRFLRKSMAAPVKKESTMDAIAEQAQEDDEEFEEESGESEIEEKFEVYMPDGTRIDS